ncbi:hypothetical protein Bca52824_054801 [Brassica carinata]|uniref:Homeobox-leucine zipper protein n=1 Tax=Brassica carinata TaxID=52824 RepID=A0A8X7UPF0_BRACI|nr:hypothetical protein Bca52824_054801 [Brassica carinata]
MFKPERLFAGHVGNSTDVTLMEPEMRFVIFSTGLRGCAVKALDKNFELENKLEAERKVKLAQELGLQPRQVAVWFQNRRARWKTKQLEKDYGVLKTQYDSLRHNFDSLRRDNESLLQEISKLKCKLNGEEEEEEENNAVMMESELSVKEEEVLLPGGKRLCHLRVWMETFQRRRSPTHPFPWESERRDGTDAGQYCWWRFSRSGYLGGDSGAAVPYESSGALVACRLRQWLSLLEGDGDAVGDSAS